jgi:hypothetical protein
MLWERDKIFLMGCIPHQEFPWCLPAAAMSMIQVRERRENTTRTKMQTKADLKEAGYTPVEEAVPPIGYSVEVVTTRLRCIGFLDGAMNWRYVQDHGLIHDVVAWGVLNLERN